MLALFFLYSYTSLNSQEVIKFTLHRLHSERGESVGSVSRRSAVQEHHRLRDSAGCVENYRCDDLLPALRCQRRMIQAFAVGWMPGTPLARGVKRTLEPVILKFGGKPADPCAATDAADAASEGPFDSEAAVYRTHFR